MRHVKMFGPSISEPSKIVNRDVPECDVEAYKRAGYQLGSIRVEKAEKPVEKAPDKKKKQVVASSGK